MTASSTSRRPEGFALLRPFACPAACPAAWAAARATAWAPALLAVVAMLLPVRASAGPLARFLALPADSAEARGALVSDDAATFAAEADSAFAFGDPARAEMEAAAAAYFAATGDSLLVWDLRFARGATAETRRRWIDGVVRDREALALRGGGDPAGAAAAYEEAATIYRDTGDLRREAVAWGSLGVARWLAGDFEGVRAAYEKALDARTRLGDPVLIGRTLNGLGSVHQQLGDLDGALAWYERARAVRETLANRNDLGTTLAYIGNVRYLLGDLDGARANYRRALDTFDDAAPVRSVVAARVGLANVHQELGEYREALDLYRGEEERLAAAGDSTGAALARRNLAISLFGVGDHEGALRALAEAAAVQESADRYELASTLNSAGQIHMDLGDFPRALEQFTRAVAVAGEAGNRLVEGQATVNLGLVYARMGLTDRALDTLEEARAAGEAADDSLAIRDALGAAAFVRSVRNEFAEANALTGEVLAMDRRWGYRGRALEDRVNLANGLGSLGRLHEAREAYRAAAAEAGELGRRDVLWSALLGVADTFERGGDLDSARVYNGEAIDVLESLRGTRLSEESKTALSGKSAYVYEAQVGVLARLAARGDRGRAEEAFVTAERGRAQALLAQLEEGHVDLDADLPPGLRDERQALDRALGTLRYRLRLAASDPEMADSLRALRGRLNDLERADRALRERIRLENPRLESMDPEAPPSLADIRRALLDDKRSVLLEYALGDSGSWMWIVTRSKLELRPLPRRDAVEALVQQARGALVSPARSGDAAYLDAARRLGEALLDPAAQELATADRVWIVPDGALHFLPFDALLTAEVDPATVPGDDDARDRFFGGLPYALTGKAVAYGPSAATLVRLRAAGGRAPAPMAFLGVGDPAFVGPGDGDAPVAPAGGALVPLPQTRREVEAAAALFPAGTATTLFGEDASEARLEGGGLLARYRILHFATHGLVDDRRPERSALVLAHPQSADEDGFLFASEIYGLDLDADLAVLSACETGLGKLVRGEGVLGLPRAFFFAGVPQVVVSLWRVSDASTADLMSAFYRHVLRDGEDPGTALAAAKSDLRGGGRYGHPFHWAPFVLMGSKRPS